MIVTERIHYVDESWNTGMRRVNKILEYEEAQGFRAWATGIYSNLPDVLVLNDDEKLVRVYEVTNYGKPEFYVARAKAERYRNTLLQFKCERVFVCSFESNLLDGKEFFTKHEIKVVVMGYQD
ncbi:hypothetical protein ACFLXG_03055 [Chloroflexota bacterium]